MRKFEVFTRRVVWAIPSPAPWNEVDKAVREAREEYQELTGQSWDDVPRLSRADEDIHVWFEVEVKKDELG